MRAQLRLLRQCHSPHPHESFLKDVVLLILLLPSYERRAGGYALNDRNAPSGCTRRP